MGINYPPGPKGNFLLGNYAEMTGGAFDFTLTLPKYGDIVTYRVGPIRFYAVFHPDYIHQVLVTDADKFHKAKFVKTIFKEYIGDSVLVANGSKHLRQRRLIQPAFHTKRIETYAHTMVDCAIQMMDRWQPDREINIDDEMMHITLHVVAKTLFNVEMGETTSNVEEALGTLQDVLSAQFGNQSSSMLPSWIPTAFQRRKKATIETLHGIIKRYIAERRASGEDKGDLLSMLLLATDETDGSKMTNEEAVHEAITLFVAGYETTAALLSWVWYLLGTHPEAEQKLQAELADVLGGRLPTASDLPKLHYTTALIKETLRLYPTVWSTNREAIAEVKIGDYTIPKGSLVNVIPLVTQRDPRFFDQPNAFMPERFIGETEKQIPRFAYFPFGSGARVCIGQQFALMESTLILATVVQRFRLNLVPNQTIEPQMTLTIRPKHGVRVIPTVRSAEWVAIQS